MCKWIRRLIFGKAKLTELEKIMYGYDEDRKT